jgi:hypothetical protein
VRILATILLRLAVVGTLLVTSITFAPGQERSDRVEAGLEWTKLANGRTDFEVSDLSLLPSRLARTAEQSNCRYKEDFANNPARFTKLGNYRLAILACWSISAGSHQVFDLSTLERPKPISFPLLVKPDGFGTTLRPGRINWDKETSIFQAVLGSDTHPALVRHTYRFDQNWGFVVVRVEVRRGPLDEWTRIWEAPRWILPEIKQ